MPDACRPGPLALRLEPLKRYRNFDIARIKSRISIGSETIVRGWFCSSGSTRRFARATGRQSLYGWPAASNLWAAKVNLRAHTAWQEIVDADPDVMVIACCGFDTTRTLQDLPILSRYPGFERLACVRSGKVYVVDGNAYFSRPGPRLVESLEILAHILHPDLHRLPQHISSIHNVTPSDLGMIDSASR